MDRIIAVSNSYIFNDLEVVWGPGVFFTPEDHVVHSSDKENEILRGEEKRKTNPYSRKRIRVLEPFD